MVRGPRKLRYGWKVRRRRGKVHDLANNKLCEEGESDWSILPIESLHLVASFLAFLVYTTNISPPRFARTPS